MSGSFGAVIVEFQRCEGADPSLPLPRYESAGAAGMDIRADLPPGERASGRLLRPGARTLVPTGLRVALPQGTEMQMRPRSGLALKHGVTLLNAPGTIDADYRGPLGVILINHGRMAFRIAHGARIAQAVIAPAPQARIEVVTTLSPTARGIGGFGSTGTA